MSITTRADHIQFIGYVFLTSWQRTHNVFVRITCLHKTFTARRTESFQSPPHNTKPPDHVCPVGTCHDITQVKLKRKNAGVTAPNWRVCGANGGFLVQSLSGPHLAGSTLARPVWSRLPSPGPHTGQAVVGRCPCWVHAAQARVELVTYIRRGSGETGAASTSASRAVERLRTAAFAAPSRRCPVAWRPDQRRERNNQGPHSGQAVVGLVRRRIGPARRRSIS